MAILLIALVELVEMLPTFTKKCRSFRDLAHLIKEEGGGGGGILGFTVLQY